MKNFLSALKDYSRIIGMLIYTRGCAYTTLRFFTMGAYKLKKKRLEQVRQNLAQIMENQKIHFYPVIFVSSKTGKSAQQSIPIGVDWAKGKDQTVHFRN